jgi:glucosamine-6-phosphate deaminase
MQAAIWAKDDADLAILAADHLTMLLRQIPDAAVALPTGGTPLGLYRTLAARKAAGRFDASRARFFNLDDFVGKSAADPQSYAAFLQQHVFGPLDVAAGRVRLLRGDAPDLAAECLAFDAAIATAGGLDLAILGLGGNGHVAFNEPGSAWDSPTRVVELAASTRAAQQGLYPDLATVPAQGLTMGLGTIRAARRVLLLVAGAAKREALAALLRGRADPRWPVTALCDHPALTVIADRALRPETAEVLHPA